MKFNIKDILTNDDQNDPLPPQRTPEQQAIIMERMKKLRQYVSGAEIDAILNQYKDGGKNRGGE